jgi:hypothetical protein
LNSIDLSHLQLADVSQSDLIDRAIMSILESLIFCWILDRFYKGGSLHWMVFSLAWFMKVREKFSQVMIECLVFGAPVDVVFARKSRSPVVTLVAS